MYLFGYAFIACLIIGYCLERHKYQIAAVCFSGTFFAYLSMIIDAIYKAK